MDPHDAITDESRDSSTEAPSTAYERAVHALELRSNALAAALRRIRGGIWRFQRGDGVAWEFQLRCYAERRATVIAEMKLLEEDRKRLDALDAHRQRHEMEELADRYEAMLDRLTGRKSGSRTGASAN